MLPGRAVRARWPRRGDGALDMGGEWRPWAVERWAWGLCEAIGRAGDVLVAAVGPVPVVIGMVLVCGLAEGLLGR